MIQFKSIASIPGDYVADDNPGPCRFGNGYLERGSANKAEMDQKTATNRMARDAE